MGKVVSYRGEQLTRRELAEKIAQGNFPESALQKNETARRYLRFLKGHVPRALEAIRQAGLTQEKAATEDGYLKESGENSAAYVSKSNAPANLENLTKLAKVFGGTLEKNSNGSPIFKFDTPKNLSAFKDFGKKKTAEIPAGIDPDATIPADKFVNVIDDSDEALAKYIAEWNAALKKTSAMSMFNPELWTAGLKIGLVYVQRGVNKFADWAAQITKTLGEDSKLRRFKLTLKKISARKTYAKLRL